MRASLRLAASPERVFAFHADVRNLPLLMPAPTRILAAPTPTSAGDRQLMEFRLGPIRQRWLARIQHFEPPRRMVDEQLQGPFRFWRHTHSVLPSAGGALLRDVVRFRFMPGPVGHALDMIVVAPVIRLLFAERHRRTRRIFARNPRLSSR